MISGLFLLTLGVCCFTLAGTVPLAHSDLQNLIIPSWEESQWKIEAVVSGPNTSTMGTTNLPESATTPPQSTSIVPASSSMYPYLGTSSSIHIESATFSGMDSASSCLACTQTAIDVSTSPATPPTVTETVVVIFTPTYASTSTATMTAATPSGKMTWALPTQFTSLESFNISAFGGGRLNLDIVKGIPPGASGSPSKPAPTPGILPSWDNSSSVIQVFYPAYSIDPANRPQGGAEFYASPLEQLHAATNVSFEYSIFFPIDFDWVRGGKLPGLYGGHRGCSGGNDARACFSTRLMWRRAGAGELYLVSLFFFFLSVTDIALVFLTDDFQYAPKRRQTEALCSDLLSVCDTTYGLSVGRSSFYFTPGFWTHVRQTVVLNTPGQHDGQFRLAVNGKEVINRTDVLYRDVPPPPVTNGDDGCSSHDDTGGLISHLLGNLVRRCVWQAAYSPSTTVLNLNTNQTQWNINVGPQVEPITLPNTLVAAGNTPSPVGFTGLFFRYSWCFGFAKTAPLMT